MPSFQVKSIMRLFFYCVCIDELLHHCLHCSNLAILLQLCDIAAWLKRMRGVGLRGFEYLLTIGIENA